MFAAGTGIAPMVPLIDLVLSNDLDITFVRLIFCCRKASDILLLDTFKRWRQHWNFSVLLCLSGEEEVNFLPKCGKHKVKALCNISAHSTLPILLKNKTICPT